MLHRYPKRQYQRLVLKHYIPTSTKSELETTTYEGENNTLAPIVATTVPLNYYYLLIGILTIAAVGFGIYLLLANYVLFVWPFPKNTVIISSSSNPPILSNNQFSSSVPVSSSSSSTLLSLSSSTAFNPLLNLGVLGTYAPQLIGYESLSIPPLPFSSTDVNNGPQNGYISVMDVLAFASKIQPPIRGNPLTSGNWSYEINQYTGLSTTPLSPYNQIASFHGSSYPFVGYGANQHIYPISAFPQQDLSSIFRNVSNNTIYVDSIKGIDSTVTNNGNISFPYKSLSYAYQIAILQTPVTIILRQGIYYLSSTLMIANISNLSIIAYPNEIINISGGIPLTNPWILLPLASYPSTLNPPLFPYNQTYYMTLPTGLNLNLDSGFNELWVNGRRQIRARYPNRDTYHESINMANVPTTTESGLIWNPGTTPLFQPTTQQITLQLLCSCGGQIVDCSASHGHTCPSPGPSSDFPWYYAYVYSEAYGGTCGSNWIYGQNSWCSFIDAGSENVIISWQWDPSHTSPRIINYTYSLTLNKGYVQTPLAAGTGTCRYNTHDT